MEKIKNKRLNNKIGFDDRLLLVTVMPIMAFIIPMVFFDMRFNRQPYYSWNSYWTTLVIVVANWFGDRYIMIFSRKKYPEFAHTRKRLIVQSTIMFFYTFVITNLLGIALKKYCSFEHGYFFNHTELDNLIAGNSAALFCTLSVAAIYETRYFMTELKLSVQEKEMFKRKSLEAQLSALKTQVNPNFLFNNLNTVCSIIPDDPKQAVNFVQQLSRVYRHILELKDERCIALADELEVIKSYSFLLKTRFGDNLDIEIKVGPQELNYKVAPLTVQLLMENAIKHNIISAEKHLKIEVFTANNSLVITNNLQRKNQPVESTGLGLSNIRNRYQLLTNNPVQIIKTDTDFTVVVPLIKD